MSKLADIPTEEADLIGASIDVFDDYRVSRSFRRGSDSQIIDQGVPERDINLNYCCCDRELGRTEPAHEHVTTLCGCEIAAQVFASVLGCIVMTVR